MDFTYDEEQQALREAVRGLVGKAYADFENRRRTVADEPGFSEKVWTQLAEMGLLGLPFEEQYGGMGAGAVEVGIVAQELGRVLAPEPFLTSVVLAGGLVAAAGSEEQKAELLGALSSGEFGSWGVSGTGSWMTVYYNGGHAYAVIAGLRLDTSGSGGSGPHWHTDMRSGSGYSTTHWRGL